MTAGPFLPTLLRDLLPLAATSEISPLLGLLTLTLLLAVLLCLVLAKWRQSLLVGYFSCGMIIANSGALATLGEKASHELIAQFAELGIVLLMFTLGIEFSVRELRHLWRIALVGGGLQMSLCVAIGGFAAWCFGLHGVECLLVGMVFGLSSTAVALKSFQEIGQVNNPGAKAALALGLLQDLLVIALFLVLPALLGSTGQSVGNGIGWALLKGVAFLLGAALLGRYGINPLLHAVAQTRSRELFTLTVISLCAGVAVAGGALNLSLALGAFAAGLVVSESIYSHRIMTDILPFKDLFLTLFFVSMGLMIDLQTLREHWLSVMAVSAGITAIKGGVIFVIARLLKLPLRPALLCAASLSSLGEFSLVLMQKVNDYRSIPTTLEQGLLVCTALGMATIPTAMRASPLLANGLERLPRFRQRRAAPATLTSSHALKQLQDHAVICGYGPVGQAMHNALMRLDITCLIIDLNVETVKRLKSQGHPVLFADASHPEALGLARVAHARLVALTFPQGACSQIVVPQILDLNPSCCILARAKFANEAQALRELGALVIHDEQESAAAMVRAAETTYEPLISSSD